MAPVCLVEVMPEATAKKMDRRFHTAFGLPVSTSMTAEVLAEQATPSGSGADGEYGATGSTL